MAKGRYWISRGDMDDRLNVAPGGRGRYFQTQAKAKAQAKAEISAGSAVRLCVRQEMASGRDKLVGCVGRKRRKRSKPLSGCGCGG